MYRTSERTKGTKQSKSTVPIIFYLTTNKIQTTTKNSNENLSRKLKDQINCDQKIHFRKMILMKMFVVRMHHPNVRTYV